MYPGYHVVLLVWSLLTIYVPINYVVGSLSFIFLGWLIHIVWWNILFEKSTAILPNYQITIDLLLEYPIIGLKHRNIEIFSD